MTHEVLRRIYMVAPNGAGWAVLRGARTVRLCRTRTEARQMAVAFAAAAIAAGERAGYIDPDLVDEIS
ncbi:hypothetical protein [Phenylobacterium sp.]|jgi:hypothetical protein|uniref:hypothetical protein n=1 Tax=Phenylobacterium sp. TaxID=1871053 RepID=UPI003783E528